MTQRQDNPLDDGTQVVKSGQATIVPDELPDLEDEGKSGIEESEPDEGGETSETASDDAKDERKYAGVFQSVDALEEAYKNLQAEYTRVRQAQKAVADVTGGESGEQGDSANTQMDALAPLAEEVVRLKYEREWDKLRQEYGDDIQERVADYYNRLSPSEQQALDNPVGARLIAQVVSAQKRGGSAKQPVGKPSSHVAPKPKLTRAEILRMSEEEYARRQPEILAFYASQENNA